MIPCEKCPFVIQCWQKSLSVVYCWSCHALIFKLTKPEQYLDGCGQWQEREATMYATLQCEHFLHERFEAGRPELHGRLLDSWRAQGPCIRCRPRRFHKPGAGNYDITHYMMVAGEVREYDEYDWLPLVDPLATTQE